MMKNFRTCLRILYFAFLLGSLAPSISYAYDPDKEAAALEGNLNTVPESAKNFTANPSQRTNDSENSSSKSGAHDGGSTVDNNVQSNSLDAAGNPLPTDQNTANTKGIDETHKGAVETAEEQAAARAAQAEREKRTKKAQTIANHRGKENASRSTSPVEIQNAIEDKKLINEANEAIRKEKEFARKRAELAHDAEVRRNLIEISELQAKKQEFKKEDARLSSQIAELGSLAATMMANSKGMGTVPVAKGNSSPILGSNNTDNSSISAEAPKEAEASKLTADEQKLKTLEKEIDPTGKLFAGKDAKTKAKIIRDYSLKRALTAKLQAEERAAAQAKINAANAAAAEKNKAEAKKRPANVVAEEVLDTASEQAGANFSGSGSSHGFSLSSSESNAEVNRMISTLDGQPGANDIQAGILETDSPSLFERVHEVMGSCLRKRCVISRVNSQ